MAGAEKLIEKIINDAQSDAEALWKEAEAKKAEMRDKLQREIDRHKAEISKAADNAVAENRKRLAAVYDLEYRKQLLTAKQEMMQKTRAIAKKKLYDLDDIQYAALMKKNLLACAVSGKGGIAVANGDKRLDHAFITAVNAELKQSAGRGELVLLPGTDEIGSGFIYIDEGAEINVSLEALLDEAWQSSETEVASVLFE